MTKYLTSMQRISFMHNKISHTPIFSHYTYIKYIYAVTVNVWYIFDYYFELQNNNSTETSKYGWENSTFNIKALYIQTLYLKQEN